MAFWGLEIIHNTQYADGKVLYYDLAQEDIFSGSGDPQFQVYRDMRDSVGEHWHTFCPYTNVLVRR
jgi:serine/threonine-protein kinase haspin